MQYLIILEQLGQLVVVSQRAHLLQMHFRWDLQSIVHIAHPYYNTVWRNRGEVMNTEHAVTLLVLHNGVRKRNVILKTHLLHDCIEVLKR